MNEYEIIGKLYVENQKQAIKLKESHKLLKEIAHNNAIKDNAHRSELLTKTNNILKYVIENKDIVPEIYFNEIIKVIERTQKYE